MPCSTVRLPFPCTVLMEDIQLAGCMQVLPRELAASQEPMLSTSGCAPLALEASAALEHACPRLYEGFGVPVTSRSAAAAWLLLASGCHQAHKLHRCRHDYALVTALRAAQGGWLRHLLQHLADSGCLLLASSCKAEQVVKRCAQASAAVWRAACWALAAAEPGDVPGLLHQLVRCSAAWGVQRQQHGLACPGQGLRSFWEPGALHVCAR